MVNSIVWKILCIASRVCDRITSVIYNFFFLVFYVRISLFMYTITITTYAHSVWREKDGKSDLNILSCSRNNFRNTIGDVREANTQTKRIAEVLFTSCHNRTQRPTKQVWQLHENRNKDGNKEGECNTEICMHINNASLLVFHKIE